MENLPQSIQLQDRVLPLKIVVNPRAMRLIMRIEPNGQAIKLVIPHFATSKNVNQFLQKYHHWLQIKIKKYPKPDKVDVWLADEQKFLFLGKTYNIVANNGRGITTLNEAEESIIIFAPPEFMRRRLKDFLIKQAELYINPLVQNYSEKLGEKVKSIKYKDTKTRWGSCTSDKKLAFSWRIMMAPPDVVKYLVAHEVSHLKEMNHSANFWHVCSSLCVNWKEARKWLKKNGIKLHSIEF